MAVIECENREVGCGARSNERMPKNDYNVRKLDFPACCPIGLIFEGSLLGVEKVAEWATDSPIHCRVILFMRRMFLNKN